MSEQISEELSSSSSKWLYPIDHESKDPLVRLRSKYFEDESICSRQKANFLQCQDEYDSKEHHHRVACELHFFEVLNCIQQYYDINLFRKYYWPESRRKKYQNLED